MNAPVFESNGLKTTLKIMVGLECTNADLSTTQVDTLQLQLQQQSFNTYYLTPMKCPHLTEMTFDGFVNENLAPRIFFWFCNVKPPTDTDLTIP